MAEHLIEDYPISLFDDIWLLQEEAIWISPSTLLKFTFGKWYYMSSTKRARELNLVEPGLRQLDGILPSGIMNVLSRENISIGFTLSRLDRVLQIERDGVALEFC